MSLRPMMSFYGSKWRAAARYPAPKHDIIIEPFAGAAGYSLRYPERQVILIERDPYIASIWRYLIAATPDEILALPLLDFGQDLRTMNCSAGGRALISLWLNGATPTAHWRLSSMARKAFERNPDTPGFWGAACRARIAAQVDAIKHWILIEGDYTRAPDCTATWFIDPPYNNKAGACYKFHDLDYSALGAWCQTRKGQVTVCENAGADWLPFSPLYTTTHSHTGNGQSKTATEVAWIREQAPQVTA